MPENATYVQYGCGFCVGNGWLSFDASPTLRIERLPIIGKLISVLFSGNERRFPADVLYGDICKGLPIAENTVRGCYASHVLEHMSLEDMRTALGHTLRMMQPGGIFRLIVPDLHERARRYVLEADKRSPTAVHEFFETTLLGRERRPGSHLQRLRLLLGGSEHLWMWDVGSMSAELQRAGFVDIRQCQYGDAQDPMFLQVEDRDRFVDPGRNILECALEARKPL